MQFAALVESIYPYNVNAVHNRLQDMFDKMDDLTDKQQSVFIVLFYFVSRAHPEVYLDIFVWFDALQPSQQLWSFGNGQFT